MTTAQTVSATPAAEPTPVLPDIRPPWLATPVPLVRTDTLPRDEWLAWRRRGLGGSDAAAVLGVSRYKSPWDVWADKMGLTPPDDPGEAAYWGQRLEPLVAEEFARRTGIAVASWPYLLQHPEHPWMLANLDRVTGDGGILECKTTHPRHAAEWDDDGIPVEYLCQVQHYLAVTGAPHAWVAVLIGGQDFRTTRIERDAAFIADLIALEAAFWRRVASRIPPEPDGSPAARRTLLQLYPEATRDEAALPPDAEAWARAYLEAAAREAAAATDKERAAQALMALLGDARAGTAGPYRVAWTPTTQRRLDLDRLKAEHPDLYAAYTVTQSTRRFRVTATPAA
ncbi:MAG: YqaJ viral recombinase family protein [Actinomycetia bacterium]|nr:YqaJ viral recombinase family protein [Actinomycetes bacterium]